MRTETTIRTLYQFDELSEKAQQHALEKLWDINTVHDWYDYAYEDAKTIGALMGIDIDKIYFSGFSSQGDGACFEGSYSYKPGSVKAVKAYAPQDTDLHDIAKQLQDTQKPYFYKLSASVKHSGFYRHSGCTDISVSHDDDMYRDMGDAEGDIKDALRSFMDWIYSQLEKEYEYQTSEEAIKEAIEANEYEFDENGELS